MVQPLATGVVPAPVLLRHDAQAGENGSFAECAVGHAAVRQLPPQDVRRLGRREAAGGLPLPLPQQLPQIRGGGGAALRCAVVGGAGAEQGSGRHGCAGAPEGAEVLHRQRVVGAFQQGGVRIAQQGGGGTLAADGEGRAAVSRRQAVGKGGTVQAVRQPPQGGQLAALAAEQQRVDAGQRQQLHAAPRECLRRGHGPDRGQLHHQIGAAADGHLRPRQLVQRGKAAPLGEIAAHGADHRVRTHGAGVGQQPGVAAVEGVKFADNTDVHGRLLSFFPILQGNRTKCNLTFPRSGIYNGENEKSEVFFMLTGLLYAMPGEIKSLLPEGAEPERVEAGVPFYRIREDVVACCGGVGKVNAAMSTQLFIDLYHPARIVNVGVAGCFEDVPIGTLVLADRFMQHDVDTSGIGDPVGLVSTVNRMDFPTAEPERARAAMDKTGYPYRVGSVATGEWFATECDRARWIAETFHPLLIEMEGGAAAQVCYRNGVPFMALKSVSDCVLAHHDFYFNFPEAMKDLNRVAMAFLDALDG